MQKIFLVRHGQDEDNLNKIVNGHRNGPLTDFGRQEAQDVGQKLLNQDIKVIYCSTLKRAIETAGIIARVLDLPKPITEEMLIERDCGVLTGKPYADIPKYSKNIISVGSGNYPVDVEGAESYPEMYERSKLLLSKLHDQESERNILLVTHGHIGKIIQAAYYDWSWEKGLRQPFFDNCDVIILAELEKTTSN